MSYWCGIAFAQKQETEHIAYRVAFMPFEQLPAQAGRIDTTESRRYTAEAVLKVPG
jgi:hypothetical protein